MELIFYEEAAKILGVTVGSLKHAVSRGELTRAMRKGHNQRLIREQVMLFKGRNISYKSLSEAEKKAWQHYADEVGKGQAVATTAIIDEETIAQIVRQELLAQNAERKAREAREAQDERERFLKDYPFLPKRVRIAIPA